MNVMEGVVTLAQESRFQLVDDGGVAHLFVLAHGAAAEPAQLPALQRHQARVRITYAEATTLIANVARKVELCDEAAVPGMP